MQIYPGDTRTFSAFFEKLGSPQGEEWLKAFHRFVAKDDPWDTRLLVIRPWRTVTIGRLKTHEEYFKAFKRVGRQVEPHFARGMVEKTPLLQKETEVELFQLTTEEMGLGGSTFYPNVCERMEKFGFTYCHPEVALALAAEEPAHGVVVVMEGVPTNKGKLGYFNVKWSDGTHWLDSGPITTKANGHEGGLLGISQTFVFTEAKVK